MLTPDFTTMVAALSLMSFLVGFHLGPIFAIAQTVARPSMRALASAIILLTATCFGQGVGPLAVGMINDALKNDYGADAVRYSLLSAAVTTTQTLTLGGPLVFALAAIGPGIGIGLIFAAYINGVARQPEANGILRPLAFLGFALTEVLALIGLVFAFL